MRVEVGVNARVDSLVALAGGEDGAAQGRHVRDAGTASTARQDFALGVPARHVDGGAQAGCAREWCADG